MDPQQCLLDARRYLDDNDMEEFVYTMDCYREWREKGGFEPYVGIEQQPGDIYHDILRTHAKRMHGLSVRRVSCG